MTSFSSSNGKSNRPFEIIQNDAMFKKLTSLELKSITGLEETPLDTMEKRH